MADTYCEAYYHFVWATKDRVEYITLELESILYPFIERKCQDHGVVVLAVNGMPDHVHLACSMPSTMSPTELMQSIKGASSHFINKEANTESVLGWQRGFAVLTFSRRDMALITNYIKKQKSHHSVGPLKPELEQVGR